MIKKMHLLPLLYLWVASYDKLVVLGCTDCTDIEMNGFTCNGKTVNMCATDHLKSWKVAVITEQRLDLFKCDGKGLEAGDKLLLFVSKGKLTNYGKYEVVTVKGIEQTPGKVSECRVFLDKPVEMDLEKDHLTCLIAQKFPTFDHVTLRNKCVLTCNAQNDGLGGVLAFEAGSLIIDGSSRIDMTGKGFTGGAGGDPRGGGGYGGQTFDCPANKLMGKGGDISVNAPWVKNKNGIGGGGAGDGPKPNVGSKGGPGGTNAGGGGADSTHNSDDGAAGGGGGGHFSGGGGGGGGSGCGGQDGGKGGSAGGIGRFAGGGGQSSCPGGHGGNGGQAGFWPPGKAPLCNNDRSVSGGNAGSANIGGGGGDSCGSGYGGGGGGGGIQFGNTNYKTHLSYGGGGGGGGGSAFTDDRNPGGKGGNGGGLLYLQLEELQLQGTILANGGLGQCLNKKRHRSAPGGSGAGGSVVIFTKKLVGDPKSKISASGGSPVKCTFGVGGGGGGGVGRWVVQEGQTVHQG